MTPQQSTLQDIHSTPNTPPHKATPSTLPIFALGLGLLLYGCQRDLPKTTALPMPLTSRTLPSPPTQRTPSTRSVPLKKKFTPKQTFAWAIPNLKPVKGVGGIRASQCATCHSEIYKEWRQSTHATALQDIQYQGELFKKSSPAWLCLNCHIPLQNQRRTIITGLQGGDVLKPTGKPNPHFDPLLQKESITCATCHVRKNNAGDSVIIGPRGSKFAPHPLRKDPAFLRKICLRCHDPQGERLTRHLVCWFKTKDEHAASPYAKKRDCVNCHMPQTRRRLVPSLKHLPIRLSHQHHWVGGGVPKWFKSYKNLLKRGYTPGLEATLLRWTWNPNTRQLRFSLQLHNKHAGHWLPTADPERFLLLIARLVDSKGNTLSQSKLRIGQTWKWEPKAHKIGDNRLKPGEKRNWTHTLTTPHAHPHTLRLLAYHVRLSTQTARYMKQHAKADNTYLKRAQHLLRHIGKHYPLASYIYREDITLSNHTRKRWTLKELIRMSQKEQHLPLTQRDY